MSWPAAYPPSRRSRSRSPNRAPYPSRASYDGYPNDPSYRGDWDTYDKDKNWSTYDRERAAYDYGRRGRSRSPPPDDSSRKRRRSLSPYERDRYDPRPRYNDDYDTHSRGYDYSSPRRGQASFPSTRRAPPDPHTFDYPASLKQYADWFRYFHPSQAAEEDAADKAAEQEAGDGSKPRNGIKSKWEKYKKEFASSQLQTMFEHHRKSPWFGEKYDPAPEMQRLRTRVRKEGWRGYARSFVLDLESGKYDPDLNEPVPEPASSVKEESSTVNGSSVDAAEDPVKEEDAMQFPMEVEDEGNDANGRGDANGKNSIDAKRNANRGEEMSVMPDGNQVMIRTIPPDIGRVKLEEACASVPGFIHLALGDPLQKRNYYRAGWMKFADDADMASVMSELSDKKIEGFKLHVTHNLRPFVNRIRFAPEVASRPERLEKDLANAKVLASMLEEEAAELRVLKVNKSKATVALVDGTTTASATDAAAPVTVDDDAPMADAPITEEEDEEEPEPTEKGSDAVDRRVEKVMAEWRERNPDANEKSLEAKKNVVALDLYLDYLRNAFHTCYYCCLVTDHVEELQRKCLKHERKPLSAALSDEIKAAEAAEVEKSEKETEKDMDVDAVKPEDTANNDVASEKPKEKAKVEVRDWKRNDERWLEWLDQKIALLINRSGVDPREYGGKSYDDELTKSVEPYIKQEDEGKFRCKTCQKLFKATSFVEKHIANKHGDLVKYLEDIPYFNNFALDPHRIQPFTHPPPVVGNSQPPPPQAFGIQGPPNDGRLNLDYRSGPFNNSGPYSSNGHWDGAAPYSQGYGQVPPGYLQHLPRNDSGRRLSDRISGFANDHGNNGVGLPPKPTPAALDSALVAGSVNNNNSNNKRGARANGPPPPPPADAKEDPRAAAGKRVSYHDMDEVAEGDIELTY